MRKKLFKYKTNFNLSCSYDIRSHMCRIHNVTNMEPLRNVKANAEQIEKIYQQCFPGRKLKVNNKIYNNFSSC